MLVDTNLIIYSSQLKFAYLRPLFLEGGATVSRITHLERLVTLGSRPKTNGTSKVCSLCSKCRK